MRPTIYNSFIGVNNRDNVWELQTPTRTDPDVEVAACTNFDITNNKKLTVRAGRTLALSGTFTDLWNANGTILGVKSGFLCSIKTDFTGSTNLRGGFGGRRVAYVNINDITVFTDQAQIGFVSQGSAYSFPTPTQKFKHAIPAGQLVEYYNGRLLIAAGNVVYQSDPIAVRFAVDINPESGGNIRQLASDVTLLKAATRGIWIGDSEGLWWCEGDNLATMKRLRKATARPVCGLAAQIDPQSFATPQTGLFHDVVTNEGIVRIGEDGYVTNLTDQKYNLPQAATGCIVARKLGNINQTLTVLRS